MGYKNIFFADPLFFISVYNFNACYRFKKNYNILLTMNSENDELDSPHTVRGCSDIADDDENVQSHHIMVQLDDASADRVIGMIENASGRSLTVYQRRGLRWMFEDDQQRHGGLVCYEMGMGKTFMMAAYVFTRVFFRAREFRRTGEQPPPHSYLLIVPKIVFYQWVAEFRRLFRVPIAEYIGPNPQIGTVTIATTGKMVRDLTSSRPRSETLFGRDWDDVFFDEAHLVRNKHTKGHYCAHQLRAARKWLITGTPFVNRTQDIASLMSLLHDGVAGRGCGAPYWSSLFRGMALVDSINNHEQLPELRQHNIVVHPSKELRMQRAFLNISKLRERPLNETNVSLTSSTPRKRTRDADDDSDGADDNESEVDEEAPKFIDELSLEEKTETMIVRSSFPIKSQLLCMTLAQMGSCLPVLVTPKYKEANVRSLAFIKRDDDDDSLVDEEEDGASRSATDDGDDDDDDDMYSFVVPQTNASLTSRRRPALDAPFDSGNVHDREAQDHFEIQQAAADVGLRVSAPTQESGMVRRRDWDNILSQLKEGFSSQAKMSRLLRDISSRMGNGRRKLVFVKYIRQIAVVVNALRRERGEEDATPPADKPDRGRRRRKHGRRGREPKEELPPNSPLSCVQYINGSVTMAVRRAMVEREEPSQVLVVMLSCAGVGLNLTAYTEVYFGCGCWSDSEQQQAIARVYRLGQTQPVDVFCYQLENSFDEYMLDVCARKRLERSRVENGDGDGDGDADADADADADVYVDVDANVGVNE